ncbi:MAG: site-specific integrase [Holosporaceae bacterium]|jgi:integrase|nr:site-specific integrase [Holosporaceae bacterium]
MAANWIKVEGVKCISYREHATRIFKKHKDRYFTAFYKLDGKTKCEAFGWESDGWTIEKASAIMNELRQNRKIGQGPRTLAEKREAAKKENEKAESEQKKKIIDERTFHDLFDAYMEQVKIETTLKTYKTRLSIYRNQISDCIKQKTLSEISVQDVEDVKSHMIENNMSADHIKKAVNLIAQVFKFAINRYGYDGEIPTTNVKLSKEDDKRERFLTKNEAESLLKVLKESSEQIHDIALISLYSGLRAGEIFDLEWQDVNFDNKRLFIKDRKNGGNALLPMHDKVEKMLLKRKPEHAAGYVFKSINGEQVRDISNSYERAVKRLGFNANVADRRQKVLFHTLRHTYASWLVMNGVDLYTVQRLMGHKDITMTKRYAYLAPEHLDKAVSTLD